MNLPLFLNQKDFCYFTIKIGKRLSSALICQRPYTGFSHFHLSYERSKMCLLWCQRPARAFLIFTCICPLRMSTLQLCVNALHGLFSFSLNWRLRPLVETLVCQRPARAFLIFTVPSQPPYKQRFPSLIFASIYLTILITRVFHRFFGMFIVYSYFLGFILKVLLSSFFLFFPFLCNVLSVSFYILSVFLIVFLERIMIMEYGCS